MIKKFEIKDVADSKVHQMVFFKLGYTWANHSQTIQYTDKKFLYLPVRELPVIQKAIGNRSNNITYSSRPLLDSVDQLSCKILQPKQQKFLEAYLNDPGLAYLDLARRVVKDGYYTEHDVVGLNFLRKSRMHTKSKSSV